MLGFLKKMNPLSGVRPQELLGVEFNTNTFKVVHMLCTGHRWEINAVFARSIEGLGDDDMARLVRQGIAECKAKSPAVVSVVPGNLVITKNIEIPSTNPVEIREIINLQAGRHTPYSREEIIVDYINIGTYRRSYTKILLIIVARNVIKRQFLIFEKAGIPVEKVFLAPEGLAASLSALLKEDTAVLPEAVIHIDENSTDFMVVFKGKPIFSRSISIGAGHFLTERDRYQARFIDEIKGSLEAYQNEDIERVPRSAVMTGAIADVGYLETPVAEALRLPLTRSPYLKNATLSQAALNAITVANKLSFLSLVACLVARKDLRVSLVPEEIKLRRAIEQRGRDLIKTGIFMLLVFMLLFLILLSKIHFKSAYLEQLGDEQKVLSVQARALEKDLAKINLIKGYLAKRGVSLEVLTALYELAPQEVQLSDIRFDEQAKFTIRGTATSMSAVFSFVDSMDKSKYFKNVKTKYTTKRKEGLKDVTDFEINCLLRLDEK